IRKSCRSAADSIARNASPFSGYVSASEEAARALLSRAWAFCNAKAGSVSANDLRYVRGISPSSGEAHSGLRPPLKSKTGRVGQKEKKGRPGRAALWGVINQSGRI